MSERVTLCFRDKVLVCPMKSAPVLLTLSDSKHVVLPVDDDSDLNVVAAFDRRGEYIYTGNAKGKVRGRGVSVCEVTCVDERELDVFVCRRSWCSTPTRRTWWPRSE